MNKKIIYIRYGELSLKGKNKQQFKDCLFFNIKNALSDFAEISITKNYDNIQIENIDNCNIELLLKIITNTPGISNIYKAIKSNSKNLENISQIILEILKNKKSFKIEAKSIDKSFYLNSMQINQELGKCILQINNEIKVDVHHPDELIHVEIHKNDVIIYGNKINGFGGFPVGINGRVLMLLSGGIDSPVASRLLLKKGLHVDFLTFISPPHTSEQALQKVRDLIKKITLNNKIEECQLYICNFTQIQHEISHISDHSYQIILMRRYFFRIANELAKKYYYDAIGTGESLGQVASQTLASMTTISSVLNEIIVLRPLLSYDKIEIIELAKKYDTYDISILPYADSCSLFVPNNPVTKPNIIKANKLEKELELIEHLYNNTIEKWILIENYKRE